MKHKPAAESRTLVLGGSLGADCTEDGYSSNSYSSDSLHRHIVWQTPKIWISDVMLLQNSTALNAASCTCLLAKNRAAGYNYIAWRLKGKHQCATGSCLHRCKWFLSEYLDQGPYLGVPALLVAVRNLLDLLQETLLPWVLVQLRLYTRTSCLASSDVDALLLKG